tara:strand:- start:263 stop:763 length:501 start_codon:yes stop_codon:yes gene_type:complete
MNKRINSKIGDYVKNFKDDIVKKIKELPITNTEKSNIVKYVYNYRHIEITKEDLQKRKRMKNSIPYHERCCALRANGEQCTRRKKNSQKFCGTHIKGTPHGEVTNDESKSNTFTKKVWAQDINGIIYFIDKDNNVYDPQDIHKNSVNPKIFAKYLINENGNYQIKQ